MTDFARIQHHRPFTAAEEEGLLRAARGEDTSQDRRLVRRLGHAYGIFERDPRQTARALLVASTVRLVEQWAQVSALRVPSDILDDLRSAAYEKVLSLIDDFEPHARFTTYAHDHIRGAIETEVASMGFSASLTRYALRNLTEVFGEDDEVAEGMSVGRIENAKNTRDILNTASIFASDDDVSEDSMEHLDSMEHDVKDERPRPEDHLLHAEDISVLEMGLESLSEPQRRAIEVQFLGPDRLTDKDASEALGQNRRVFQRTRDRALRSLRDFYGSDHLAEVLNLDDYRSDTDLKEAK